LFLIAVATRCAAITLGPRNWTRSARPTMSIVMTVPTAATVAMTFPQYRRRPSPWRQAPSA
jgi:hypothetical protein